MENQIKKIEMGGAYSACGRAACKIMMVWAGHSKGKTPLGRFKLILGDNIKINLIETG
jgi:hypothetical protein